MKDFYEKPEPSLCDNCRYAYYLEGGSIGIGTYPSKNYRQRYCAKLHISIHMEGKQKCEYYLEGANENL